jgi:hypothetical protein
MQRLSTPDGLRVVVYPNDHRPGMCMSSVTGVKRS